MNIDLITPAYVGAAAVGGLYVARYIRGSGGEMGWTQLALAAGTAAAATVVTPAICARLVCPHSPGAPLVEAAASSVVSWAAILAMSDMESANMFVPVQIGAYLVGTYAAKKLRAFQVAASAPADSGAEAMAMGGVP